MLRSEREPTAKIWLTNTNLVYIFLDTSFRILNCTVVILLCVLIYTDALTRSFGRLKFKIDLHTDLKDDEIVQCLKKISAINHLKYDCFICCILSHGGENHVFGVNGRKVHLGDIMALFRFCTVHFFLLLFIYLTIVVYVKYF